MNNGLKFVLNESKARKPEKRLVVVVEHGWFVELHVVALIK
jgi:hypothetical protein